MVKTHYIISFIVKKNFKKKILMLINTFLFKIKLCKREKKNKCLAEKVSIYIHKNLVSMF